MNQPSRPVFYVNACCNVQTVNTNVFFLMFCSYVTQICLLFRNSVNSTNHIASDVLTSNYSRCKLCNVKDSQIYSLVFFFKKFLSNKIPGHSFVANVTQKGVNSAFIKVCFQWWINTYLVLW